MLNSCNLLMLCHQHLYSTILLRELALAATWHTHAP